MTISEWGKKYGALVAYTTGVVLVTGFLIRFDGKFSDGNQQLSDLNDKMKDLSGEVKALQVLLTDREKYDRWNRGYNARMKRLFNANGWEYDIVE